MNSRRKRNTGLLVLCLALLAGADVVRLQHKLTWREAIELSVRNRTEPQPGKSDRNEREDNENEPTDPGGAFRFRRLQMQDENGEIPLDGMIKAHHHLALMKAEQQRRIKARQQSGKPQGILEAGIAPDSWSWMGPGNVGGRIRSIVIDPADSNKMWVGSVGGGIWRSTNAGFSWFPVNDFQANLAVTTMVINPANTNIMYAGTGEGFLNTDAIQGAGIFKSTDAGVTWNQLPSTANNNFFFVNRLAISPDGNTLLAATSQTVDVNNVLVQSAGIWRSTDGGTNWSRRVNLAVNNSAVDLDFLANDSNRAVAGELGAARFSLDGGLTWAAATFTPAVTVTSTNNGRVELANALITSLVYAVVNQNNGEVYRSNDGGQSYTRVNTGTNFFSGGAGNQGWYDNALWLNPQDPDTVIVGGIHLWRGRYSQPNLPLTQISDGSSNSAHADHHIIVAHPGFNNTTNRIVFFGNDGGLYRANDVSSVAQTSGWTNLNNLLGITQFYGGAASPITGIIIGGAQDNGTVRFSGDPQGWSSMQGSDGGFCAADPTDANYFYGETQNLGALVRSTNGGMSSSSISAGIGNANQNPPQSNFITPFILDPNNPNTMLVGAFSLWRSTNVKAATPTWTADPTKPNPNGSFISAIVVSPVTSDLIVVAHNNGDIYRTFNGTSASPTWAKIDTASLPNRFVTRLVIDSTRASSWIYATFAGFAGDNVYRTTDNGATWVNITGVDASATGLPNVPVFTLAIHPVNPNFLYVGTEVGVFTSADAGASWDLPQDGPANVSVQELFWLGGDLIAATHGRGIYRASGGVYVDCTWNGPFNGTFAQPFKTITAAVNAVTTYRTIWVKPCNYDETFLLPNNAISKHLEIRSLGGTALIGKP